MEKIEKFKWKNLYVFFSSFNFTTYQRILSLFYFEAKVSLQVESSYNLYLDPHVAGISISPLIFGCSFVRSCVALSLSKLVLTSPPKLLNELCSNFQEMFLDTSSCASSHYFSNISVRLSVNQLSISLSYFHWNKLVITSPPKPMKGLSSYFQGMFL